MAARNAPHGAGRPDLAGTGKVTRRDLGWRAIGVASLVVAGVLKAAFDAIAAGTVMLSPGIGSVLGLACFLIACFGAVLLVQGARIRDRWLATLSEEEAESKGSGTGPDDGQTARSCRAGRGS